MVVGELLVVAALHLPAVAPGIIHLVRTTAATEIGITIVTVTVNTTAIAVTLATVLAAQTLGRSSPSFSNFGNRMLTLYY